MHSYFLESVEIKGEIKPVLHCSMPDLIYSLHSHTLIHIHLQVGVIYGSPEVTSGGNALKFYSSVRLDVRRKEILPENTGIRVKVKVVKNKVAAPFKVVMMDILFGTGIDSVGCILDAAQDLEIVERKGSWYSYKGKNVAQGRHNVVELMKADPDLADALQMEVRLALSNLGKESEEEILEKNADTITAEEEDSADVVVVEEHFE